MEYVLKTITAKVVELTNSKRELLELEYTNYQKAFHLSKQFIAELGITSAKQATDLLYKRTSEYALSRYVNLYSAAYQMAYRKALGTYKSKKEQPLRLRNDTFNLRKTDKEIAAYWAKIPVYGKRGGVRVALKMSPKHEQLLQCPEIQICDSELLKLGNEFFLHVAVKKCVDTTPKLSGKLAIIGIDSGIRNTAVSVVLRDGRITGVDMYSGKRLEHKVKQAKAKLAKFNRHVYTHNSRHCVEKAMDMETIIGCKLSNYTRDYLHKVSSEIIAKAIELHAQGYEVLIACENLKQIRKRISGKLHWWAFRKLLDFVKYKAEWEGIPYMEVEPTNTSRICPKCRNYDKKNRRNLRFICTECGYNANADLVGAMNIATRSLGFLELHALGNGRCESAQEVVLTELQAVMSDKHKDAPMLVKRNSVHM